MNDDGDSVTKGISQNTHITLGLLATVILVAAWLIRGQYSAEYELKLMRLELKSALTEMQAKMDATVVDRWSSADMRRWARELRDKNPTLTVPDPEHR
jgi:hypothetical protein